MQSHAPLTVLFAFAALAFPACACPPDDRPVEEKSIAALEARISQAEPRQQCFLYAQLIHQVTEYSLKQYGAGHVDEANDLLKQIQQLAHKIHLSVAENDKRLKNAEILLRCTAFRLNSLLHSSSSEERPIVQETLAQVNQVQNEAMLEVFRK